MSKKINLVTPGISRSSLLSLFKQYLFRKNKEEEEYWKRVGRCRFMRGRDFWLFDDEDDYDIEMAKLSEYYGGIEDDYPRDDDYYVDDDGCIVFPISSGGANHRGEDEYWEKMSKLNSKGKKKHNKHRSRRGNKRVARVIDIDVPYSGNEEDPDELGAVGGNGNKIYYYPDYHDKYERIEFDSLIEFDEYCQEEGLAVPPYIGEKLAYNPVSHCCLNPIAKERGVLEIMAEESYAEMMYEACEEAEVEY